MGDVNISHWLKPIQVASVSPMSGELAQFSVSLFPKSFPSDGGMKPFPPTNNKKKPEYDENINTRVYTNFVDGFFVFFTSTQNPIIFVKHISTCFKQE